MKDQQLPGVCLRLDVRLLACWGFLPRPILMVKPTKSDQANPGRCSAKLLKVHCDEVAALALLLLGRRLGIAPIPKDVFLVGRSLNLD